MLFDCVQLYVEVIMTRKLTLTAIFLFGFLALGVISSVDLGFISSAFAAEGR